MGDEPAWLTRVTERLEIALNEADVVEKNFHIRGALQALSSDKNRTERPDGVPSGTVMVVDDEEAVADLYTSWLSSDFDVMTAYDGDSALSQITPAVDVVLLDRRMPGRSGDAVLEEIRSRGLDCRVGMVTAIEPDFDVIDMGFDGYVVKPVSRSDLHSHVEELINLSSYGSAIQDYYRLSTKKAVLEATLSPPELAESDEYGRLIDNFQLAKTRADEQMEELTTEAELGQLF